MATYPSLQITQRDRLVTVTMDHGKVNAIDAQLSQDLRVALLALERDDSVAGVVLSGKPHCFCAGLNVVALATANEMGLRQFFREYLLALQALVRFSKPLVAAVTGFAPAGGTIIALTADYRIMGRGPKHTVGMNEFNMSLQIPRMMASIYAYYRGTAAWPDVQQAKMYNSDEALRLGLVDESVEVEEVLARAQAYCEQLTQVHPPVYARTKAYLRNGLLQAVDHDIERMVEVIAEDFTDPKFRQMMDLFVASLKK